MLVGAGPCIQFLSLMRLRSPEEFASAIRAIEAELGVWYPPSAAALLAELAAMVETARPRGLFKEAHLLTTATEVAAIRNELGGPLYDGYLLPFLSDGRREFPHVYGFDLSDPARDRIAVYSVHTIVHNWAGPADFLGWAAAEKRSWFQKLFGRGPGR